AYLFGGLETGLYCVIGDFDGDGFDAEDVSGEVEVEAGVLTTIQLDELSGVGLAGTVLITATVGGAAPPATAIARVYEGACVDVDVTTTPLFEGDGLE